MSDLILNNFLLILLLLIVSLATSTTSMPSLLNLSSSQYDRYLTFPLPADETTAAGKDLKWCTRGHVPDSQILQLRL